MSIVSSRAEGDFVTNFQLVQITHVYIVQYSAIVLGENRQTVTQIFQETVLESIGISRQFSLHTVVIKFVHECFRIDKPDFSGNCFSENNCPLFCSNSPGLFFYAVKFLAFGVFQRDIIRNF